MIKSVYRKLRKSLGYENKDNNNKINTSTIEGLNNDETDKDYSFLGETKMFLEKGFILLDTETTGLGSESEVIELAAFRLVISEEDYFIDPIHFSTYFKSDKVNSGQGKNGITRDKLEFETSKGYSNAKELVVRFLEFAGPDCYFVAYNAIYDLRMLKKLFLSANCQFQIQMCLSYRKKAGYI